MFCPNCGTRVNDDSRFCGNCGTPLSTAAPAPAQEPIQQSYQQCQEPVQQSYQQPYQQQYQQATGMRTEEDVLDFFRNTLQFKEKYVQKYRKAVSMLVQALMPNEAIEFAFMGVNNMGRNGGSGMLGYAMTNMRMLIAHPENSLVSINNAMAGRRTTHGVEAYTYDQIGGVSYNKGLMLGTITIDFYDGSGDISLDRGWVEQVYNGINETLFKYRRGGVY